MSPHPATCVPHVCLLLSPPLSLQLRLPRSSACPSRSPAQSAAFFMECQLSTMCVCLCVELWWQFGMRNVVKGQGNTTAGPVQGCSLGWAPVLVAPRRTSLRTEG